MGCGKSTVLELFRELGMRTIEADKVVRELLANDDALRADIRVLFDAGVFLADGSIDRPELGRRVFADPDRLRHLEKLIHPRVRSYWTAQIEADPASNWIVEIPLLFENKLESQFDYTICVFSSLETQLLRLRQRNISETDALARIRMQLPLSLKCQQADFVLSNNGERSLLKRQVSRLYENLGM
jgi:dephospho-CoA kinase